MPTRRPRSSTTTATAASETLDLAYHKIFLTTDMIGGSMVGGLYDSNDRALTDNDGPMAADGPDGTSLIQVPELTVPGGTGNPLAMVVNFEYRELPPNDGVSKGGFWSKLPAATGLALIDQNRQNGSLSPKSYQNVSFKGVNGGWIHCGSTLSAWGTHLSSEEYEPDAKTRGGLPAATGTDDATDINSFSKYYFGDAAKANPYHYGLLPEVSIDKSGKATVVKHYATGRYAREMMEMAADNRTGIGGDDGANTGLFMFVADAEKNLSAGTLYAAKVTQTAAADGGSFTLKWIKLGRSTDAEIKALVDGGITFSDIFLVSNTDPGDASYRMVTTYNGTEWLKLKPGMEKAAAFLETRRYAAYLGATTEFSKMEYIAFNAKDRKFYVVISRVERGMADAAGDIRVARNDGGVVYEMATAHGAEGHCGNAINSEYVGTTLVGIPELNGGWLGGSEGRRRQPVLAGQDLRAGQPALCRVDPDAVHRRGYGPAQQQLRLGVQCRHPQAGAHPDRADGGRGDRAHRGRGLQRLRLHHEQLPAPRGHACRLHRRRQGRGRVADRQQVGQSQEVGDRLPRDEGRRPAEAALRREHDA